MKVQLAHLMHGNKGYSIWIVEVPVWAVLAERSADWVGRRLDHLCCGAPLPDWIDKIGFGPTDKHGIRENSIGWKMFMFGQRVHSIACRREKLIAQIPVTREFVAEFFPDRLTDWLDEEEEENV